MSSEPSIHEANKMVRVLTGERMKFTVRLHKADGSIIEFQADERPKVKWIDDLRAEWMCYSGYDANLIMLWPVGGMLLVEENKP